MHERLELAEQDKRNAVELAETKVARDLEKAAAASDKEIQGLNFREISNMLGVPVGTVKSRSHRARLELASKILALDPAYAQVNSR